MIRIGAHRRIAPVETFALVHGAWHGAWCWEPLLRELEARGHRAVAVDLPCDDVDAGCERYAEVVVEALDGVEDAIAVGHSLGGLTIPLVPAKRLVFVCALLPGGGFGDEVFVPGFSDGRRRDELGRSYWFDAERAIMHMYQDCEPGIARAAVERLRPQASVDDVVSEVPDVDRVSIVAANDRAVSPDWSRWAARELLGVEPVEIGTGHSPMLASPADLADLLL
jgi:pimeloyl-ACP methyl ester carboxylesterase